MNVAIVEMNPMNKLTHIKLTNAVLGTLNQNAAGYMSGIMDHLKTENVKLIGIHLRNS